MFKYLQENIFFLNLKLVTKPVICLSPDPQAKVKMASKPLLKIFELNLENLAQRNPFLATGFVKTK